MTSGPSIKNREQGVPALWLAFLYPAIVLAPVVAALWGPPPLNWAAELGSAAGLAAGSMLVLQYVTSGRFERIAGHVGIDRVIGFHRFAGWALIIVILAHIVALAVAGGGDPAQMLQRLVRLLTAPSLLTGVVAAVLIGMVVWAALRRDHFGLRYEIWRFSHSIGATVALACLVDHALARGTYIKVPAVALIASALALVAVVSLLNIHVFRSALVLGAQWRVETVRPLGPELWELLLRHEAGRPFTFRAGQFVWVCFHGQPTFCDNPFSIASAPDELPALRFVIKEAGDFTREIGQLRPGTVATLDGPHGNLVDWDDAASAVILISGGVGIAPIIGILRSLARSRDRRPVRLIVATRTAAEQVFAKEIAALGSELDFKSIGVVEVSSSDWSGRVGQVDDEALASLLEGLDRERAIALLCGPKAMMEWASGALDRVGIPSGRIRYELFDYDTAADASSRRTKQVFQVMLLAISLGLIVFATRALVSGD
jgi:predicted ferric reductase